MTEQKQDQDMSIPKPRVGPFEINLNTVVVFLGFASGFIAWGYTLSEVSSGLNQHSTGIERLESRVTAVETQIRVLDNHELRLQNLAERTNDSAQAIREMSSTLSTLGADMRVVKEILQRLETNQAAARQ